MSKIEKELGLGDAVYIHSNIQSKDSNIKKATDFLNKWMTLSWNVINFNRFAK